jgi:hypothetical protein
MLDHTVIHIRLCPLAKSSVLRYIMNGVCQFEWISMTLGDSDMLSTNGVVSWDDSVALLALANALLMLGSWSSCMKTPGGIIGRLEPSLANASMTSFFPRKMCRYLRPLKLFSRLRSS